MNESEKWVKSWATETIRARWAQVVFWERQDLEELHRRERASRAALGLTGGVPYAVQFIEAMQAKHGLRPFWPKGVGEDEARDRLLQFYAEIFPLWAPRVHRAFETEKLPGFPAFDDLTILHACDLAICGSGARPDRVTHGRSFSFGNSGGSVQALAERAMRGRDGA